MPTKTGMATFLILVTTFCLPSDGLQIRPVDAVECPPSSSCIRKCCPENHVWDFVRNVCRVSSLPPESSSFPENFFNQTFAEMPAVVVGRTCPAESEMKAQVNHPDTYEVLPSGQVLISGRKLDLEDYCVDYVESDGVLGKALFVCTFQQSGDQIAFPDDAEDYAAEEKVERINISKCCNEPDKFLSPLSKQCYKAHKNRTSWPPPVTSANGNTVSDLSESAFHITHLDLRCPVGYMKETSVNFKFYTDGTVAIPGTSERLPQGRFCIEALDDTDYPTDAPNVVQYCKPDICRNGTACVRKCCPEGFKVKTFETPEAMELRCVPTDIPFFYEFCTTDNVSMPISSVPHVIRSGAFPTCEHNMNLMDPDSYPDEKFHLLPDSGNLYLPLFPAESREYLEYCIDNIEFQTEPRPLAFTCFPPPPPEIPGLQTALALYPVVMSFSIIFLILTFLVYAMLPELQNLHGLTIMCHVFSLTVTYIGLCLIQTGTVDYNRGLCVSTAIVVHFFFLATFAWLNIMGYDLWSTFRNLDANGLHFWLGYVVPSKKITAYELVLHKKTVNTSPSSILAGENEEVLDNSAPLCSPSEGECVSEGDMRRRDLPGSNSKMRRFTIYSCFAWGVPLLIVVVGQIIDNIDNLPSSVIKPSFGTQKCWFHDNLAMLSYFYGPVGVSILTNVVFFAITATKLYKASRDATFATQQSGRKERFRIILYLFVLMGVFWIFEVISFAVQGSAYIWIIFDIMNIMTGFFIFVIFVCKRQVIQLLRKRYSFFNRGWKAACKGHPEWDRKTDPEGRTTNSYGTTSQKGVSTNAKRKISTTSVTNVNTRDSASEMSDKETTNLKMNALSN